MFIDSHCHLDRLKTDKYESGLQGAIHAAFAEKVTQMLCVCIDLEHVDEVLAIAEAYPEVWASVGVHPSSLEGEAPGIDRLISLARHKKVIAIGETGLDYSSSHDYEYSAEQKAQQIENFSCQLKVSKRIQKPTIVHTRDAREDTIRVIKEKGDEEIGGVLHCFTENWEMAKQALELNYYISFSGIITFKNAESLREVVCKVPLNRILIETDSPYLAPVPFRGKPNEPKYIPQIAKCLAELKGVSIEKIAEITRTNFFTLFKGAACQ